MANFDEFFAAELLKPKLVNKVWRSDELKTLCYGSTAVVKAFDDTSVLKASSLEGADGKRLTSGEFSRCQVIETERLIYKRLDHHPRICRYIQDHQWGVMLERAKTCVTLILRELGQGETLEPSRSLKWSIHLAEALYYIHSKGVIHFDISCNNMLITEDDDLKLCDFGGSSIDGSDHTAIYDQTAEKLDEPQPKPHGGPAWIRWRDSPSDLSSTRGQPESNRTKICWTMRSENIISRESIQRSGHFTWVR